MMEIKKDLLISYIKANIAPILILSNYITEFENSVVIPANISIKELNGFYDEVTFKPPKWLNAILNTNENKILIIDKIDSINKEEQLKFCELLKYRKISTFKLPENCVIIITADEISREKINEEIYALVAHI